MTRHFSNNIHRLKSLRPFVQGSHIAQQHIVPTQIHHSIIIIIIKVSNQLPLASRIKIFKSGDAEISW